MAVFWAKVFGGLLDILPIEYFKKSFWPCPWHVEVPGPGIEPVPKQVQDRTCTKTQATVVTVLDS